MTKSGFWTRRRPRCSTRPWRAYGGEKAVAAFQPPPLPELPSATRDKRGVVDETDEKRRERYDKEKALIDRARRVAEGKALTGAKIAAGPYGERRKKTSHWEYVLCEIVG